MTRPLSQEFGAKVRAIDLSANMIDVARERLQQTGLGNDRVCSQHRLRRLIPAQVVFTIADVTQQEFAEGTFDAIYRF